MHNRRSIRLKGYDYAQTGAYFVTICTHERVCRFGNIEDNTVILSDNGKIVQSCWEDIPIHFPMVELDAFVVMPNHIHGIIVIANGKKDTKPQTMIHHASAQFAVPIAHSLSSIVGNFKAAVTRQVNRIEKEIASPLWQRNYYEHIIRDEADLQRIQAYVEINPTRWQEDTLYFKQ